MPQHGIAWIVDGMQDDASGNGFSFFGTNFTIPPPPSNPGDVLIYYWPGTEDEGMDDVTQPVLQYGNGPSGGGNFWVYQSWFVSADGTILTGPQIGPLDPMTELGGQVELDGQQYTSLAIAPNDQYSALSIANTETTLQTRAYLTVEIYNLGTDCSMTPPDNKLTFTNIVMIDGNNKPVTPNFIAEVQHQACNHKVIPQGDTVTITWQSA